MNFKPFERMMITVLIIIVLLFAGDIYVSEFSYLGNTDAAIVFLAAVLGGGCYWIGSNRG